MMGILGAGDEVGIPPGPPGAGVVKTLASSETQRQSTQGTPDH